MTSKYIRSLALLLCAALLGCLLAACGGSMELFLQVLAGGTEAK